MCKLCPFIFYVGACLCGCICVRVGEVIAVFKNFPGAQGHAGPHIAVEPLDLRTGPTIERMEEAGPVDLRTSPVKRRGSPLYG